MKKFLLAAAFAVLGIAPVSAQSGPGLYGGGYPGAKYSGQQDMLFDLIFNGSTSVTGSGGVAVAQLSPVIITPNITTGFYINSVLFGTQFSAGANYNAILSGAGTDYAFQSGDAGDPRNYYKNTNHRFASIGGTTIYADILSTGVKIYGATSGGPLLAAQAVAGTPTLTLPTGAGTLASSAATPLVLNATTGALTCPTCATSAASLTANQLVIGSGSQGTQSLGTLGTTTTVLHGNAAGAPTFGAVAIGDVSASTGTGSFVFSATPTFTGTPILAAPSATTLIVGSSATLPASPAIVTITANATTLPAPPTGTNLHIGGANSTVAGATIDAFASSPTLTFRRADTSAAAPSAVQSGEVLMSFGASGYGATAYTASQKIQIVGKATENWSDTAQGTSIQFNTVPNTTVAAALAMIIQNSGGVSIGTSTDLGIGTLLANSTIKSLSTTASTSSTTGSGLFGGGLGVAGAIYAGSEVTTGAVAVASLPTCNAAHKASRHFVTDANAAFTAGIGAVVAAGGANNVPVTCDGTNWRIG